MSKIEGLTKTIESLSKEEQEKLINNLLEKMTTDEIKTMLERVKDNQELIGILKTIEPVFEDWVNEEDSIYDSL
jgi:beta-galactosidase/beta-glucuronidase